VIIRQISTRGENLPCGLSNKQLDKWMIQGEKMIQGKKQKGIYDSANQFIGFYSKLVNNCLTNATIFK